MIILIPDGMNLAEFEEEMTQQMFQKYFDVNFKPDEDENLLFKENIVNLTMPLFEETHVNHHLDKSLLQVMLSQLSHSDPFWESPGEVSEKNWVCHNLRPLQVLKKYSRDMVWNNSEPDRQNCGPCQQHQQPIFHQCYNEPTLNWFKKILHCSVTTRNMNEDDDQRETKNTSEILVLSLLKNWVKMKNWRTWRKLKNWRRWRKKPRPIKRLGLKV